MIDLTIINTAYSSSHYKRVGLGLYSTFCANSHGTLLVTKSAMFPYHYTRHSAKEAAEIAFGRLSEMSMSARIENGASLFKKQ